MNKHHETSEWRDPCRRRVAETGRILAGTTLVAQLRKFDEMFRVPCRSDQRATSTDDCERKCTANGHRGIRVQGQRREGRGQRQQERQQRRGVSHHESTCETTKRSEYTRNGKIQARKPSASIGGMGRFAKKCISVAQLDTNPAKQASSSGERVEEVVAGLFLTWLEKNPELKPSLGALGGQLAGLCEGVASAKCLDLESTVVQQPVWYCHASFKIYLLEPNSLSRVNSGHWTGSGQQVKDLGT